MDEYMVFLRSPGDGGAAGAGAGAGGDAGGDAGAAAAQAAAQAQETEEQRRSAREHAERFGYTKPRRMPAQPQQADDGLAQQQNEQQPQRMAFRDLIKSQDYKAEADEYIQGIIKDRLKGSKAQEQRLQALTPILSRVAQRYGIDATDPNAIDLDALQLKMDQDTSGLEEEALEKGMDVQVLANLKSLERQNAELRQREQAFRKENEEREAFANIARQGAELQKIVPGFDVAAEMQSNPQFARMIMPPSMRGAGLSVEEAYFATHHQEMMASAMQATQMRTQQQVVNAIRSGSRPIENGMNSSAGGAAPGMNPAGLSPEERRAIKERARRGEQIGF